MFFTEIHQTASEKPKKTLQEIFLPVILWDEGRGGGKKTQNPTTTKKPKRRKIYR